MSRSYSYSVDEDAVACFHRATKPERDQLVTIFQSLASAPTTPGDFVETDPVGRQIQVKRFGRWTVWYWSDHAAREVRIVELEQLGH